MKSYMIALILMLPALSFAVDEKDAAAVIQWKTNDVKIQLQREPDGSLRVKGGTANKAVLKKADDGYALGEKRAQGDHVSDATGKVLHTITSKNNEYRLVEGSAVLARIKLKSEKADVYDGSGHRTARIKTKPEGYSIKPESGADTKVKGAASLKEASFFALPLPDDEKILFWSLEKKP